MSNILNNYLNNVTQGLLNPKGNLGDFSHANKLFSHSAHRLSPKTKYLYHVAFELTPEGQAFATSFNSVFMTEFGLLVRSADLPQINMEVETKKQYNRNKNVQTSVSYDPVNITFHDDSLGITTALLEGYYRYYFADGNYTTDSLSPEFVPRNLYDANIPYRYGYDNDSKKPFFNKVTIYQMSRKQYTSFTLVNPMITKIQHDTMDSYDTGTAQNQITIAYEGVFYDRGPVSDGDPTGFAQIHYDNQPSSLTVLGGGSSTLLGAGGVVEGLSGIFNDVATGNIGLDTIIEAVNTYQNAKELSSETLRREGVNVLANVGGAVLNSTVSGIANTIFPKTSGNGSITQNGTTPRQDVGPGEINPNLNIFPTSSTSNTESNRASGGKVDTNSTIYESKIRAAEAANNPPGGG